MTGRWKKERGGRRRVGRRKGEEGGERKERRERKDHYSIGSPPTDFILNVKQVSEDDNFVYQ